MEAVGVLKWLGLVSGLSGFNKQLSDTGVVTCFAVACQPAGRTRTNGCVSPGACGVT